MSARVTLKNNPPLLLVILLALHFLLVTINRAPDPAGRRYGQIWLMSILQPFQSLLATSSSGVGGVWHNYFTLRDARQENERLRQRASQLETELLQAKSQIRLGEQVQAVASWKPAPAVALVPARIIARDATQWFKSFTIDRGSLSGITRDMPVVTPEGLVGRVIVVAPNASRVLLLTDEQHGAGAIIGQLADAQILGVIKGKNSQQIEMRFVSGVPEKITPGEPVVTSGQDGLYPKGIIIGRVAPLPPGQTTVPTVIDIEPAAPLSKLELVGVMLVSKDQLREQLNEVNKAEQQSKPPDRKRGRG